MATVTHTYSARPNPNAHDRQRAECEALARELGYDVTRTYDDEGGARLALTGLLADAAAGRVTGLLVSSIDRLGRTIGTAPRYVDAFHEAGVTIYATTEGTQPLSDSSVLPTLRALSVFEEERTESHRR